MAKNLRDLAIIPPETRERFLPLQAPGLEALVDAGLTLAGLSTFSRGYEILRPRPAVHLALYVLAGSFVWETGGTGGRHTGPGLLTIPAGTYSHYLTGDDPWRAVWFHLAPGAGWEDLEPAFVPLREGCPVEALAEGLLAEAHSPTPSVEALDCYARLVLVNLRRDLGSPALPPAAQALDRTAAAVRGDVSRPWTLGDLSRFAGLSPRHLNRLFHERFGTSPLRYVTAAKMRHARELLEHTALGVEGAALAVGYENPFAFSTAFKREMGLTPSACRP